MQQVIKNYHKQKKFTDAMKKQVLIYNTLT